jgi:hypothetical protein
MPANNTLLNEHTIHISLTVKNIEAQSPMLQHTQKLNSKAAVELHHHPERT